MEEAFAGIWDCHVTAKVPLRTAAYMVGVRRVLKSTTERGFD
jgi:glutamate dehydrogenase/leucine dehydrogenase